MANSRSPRPLGSDLDTLFRLAKAPARTPGPLGRNDQGDQNVTSLLGDTPGPLGIKDHGYTTLTSSNQLSSSTVERGRRKYTWNGRFNWKRIEEGMRRNFTGSMKFGEMSKPHLKILLALIEDDLDICDIRWMSYILATAYWETSHVEQVSVAEKNKKGCIVVRKKRCWVNMNPVEETGHGAGRNYFLPVKVKLLPSGEALVTEQDGDQFTVQKNGNHCAVTARARMGSTSAAPPTRAYQQAEGTPLSYFGRGYVQLTWWANYAKAGANLGQGLDFLIDPDKVMVPSTAYAIMSFGMRTGKGFANGHRLKDYIAGESCDYVGARRMVNGTDHSGEIAMIALRF